MNLKSRILICGGRDYVNYNQFTFVMLELCRWFAKDYCIIEGGASGADAMGKMYAWNRGVPFMSMPANFPYYHKSAGPIRNGWMLKWAMPDLIIAFPGGTGTANMVEQARAAGIDVYEVPVAK